MIQSISKKLEIFNETFETGLLKELESIARYQEVKSGETIIDIGQIVRTMPIILKGTVKVSR
ncbi:MAG: hypothetical protein WAR77_07445, partial [Saprospiraceae bacterium]